MWTFLFNFYLKSLISRSCPQNPWGHHSTQQQQQQQQAQYQLNTPNNINTFPSPGNHLQSKKVLSQNSVDCQQKGGLGVPSVLLSQSRTPPPYTEQHRTNLNYSDSHKSDSYHDDEERIAPPYTELGRTPHYPPLGSTPSFHQKNSLSWNLLEPVQVTTPSTLLKKTHYKCTEVWEVFLPKL